MDDSGGLGEGGIGEGGLGVCGENVGKGRRVTYKARDSNISSNTCCNSSTSSPM